MSGLYEPLNVYKPAASAIGTVDGPFEYVSLGVKMPWPFPTRMTVVQLQSGELFLHSPTAFDATLAAALTSLGRVRHLVSPNRGHYAHIGEWGRAFPDAVAWASPGVRARARSQRIKIDFARDLGPAAPLEWADEIDQLVVPGVVLDEVVFFHRTSRTLILADTIMNFEPPKLGEPYRTMARLFGIAAPQGGMPIDMRLSFWPRRDRVRKAYQTIQSWAPARVIISHGRWFDTELEAAAALRHSFGWAL
jgi:Domain of unknown function (DUF4336)